MRCDLGPVRSGSEAGETLLEVVISVFMISIAVVMIIAAVGAGVDLSLGHKRVANTDVALKRLAEAVKAQAYAPGATTYSVAGVTLPTGITALAPTVKCLSGISGSKSATTATNAPCALPTDVQLVTLVAKASDNTETTTIAKRNG
jgi:hypothetical protein